MSRNEKSKIVTNCISCGRDTTAKDSICAKCLGIGRAHGLDDRIGRKARSTYIIGGTAIEEVDFESSPNSPSTSEVYHGPTIRDDL